MAAEDADRAKQIREDVLASAKVWREPSTPVGEVNLRSNPAAAGPFREDEPLSCRFLTDPVGGTTPKFYCVLSTGERVKVKYGAGNPELHAEVAASRLLNALGFGADHMFIVQRVACAGCPSFPFQSLRCLQRTGSRTACFPRGIDEARVVNFDVAVIERKLEGRVVEAADDQGWGWYELDRIDPARGGSSREEVDAFRLMAVLLAHWDNKNGNQRLICPPGADGPDGRCTGALAIMQDLGSTFGPLKLDLHNWKRERIWTDPATCTVSMKHFPWGGGTFPDARISEGGRQLLLRLLEQLSDSQLRDLFEGSRATTYDQVSAEARSADGWIRAFRDKIQQIRSAGPCGE